MKDPSTAARLEAKMEHMLKVGEEKLKQGAGAAMEQAMADMANPEVMAEMAKMLKDPLFQAQLAAMTKDPSFKNYVTAVSSLALGMLISPQESHRFHQMEEMMQDPTKKKKLEKVSEEFRSQL